MIPKIIHYIWVGEKPKTELVLKCIESWKKHCPNYTIMEWNNESLKKIHSAYAKEAYDCKKWAFVSDYLRLYALNQFGGIYVDTDLEITAPLDEFLENDFFIGHEIYENKLGYQTALIGASKENSIISNLLDEYNHIHFLQNEKMDMTPNPKRFSKYFHKIYHMPVRLKKDTEITLSDKQKVYPSYYFCLPQENKKNYAIHHYVGSWLETYSRKNKFSIGSYSLIKIRKNKGTFSKEETITDKFPLKENEKILFKFLKNKQKMICLIKEYKK